MGIDRISTFSLLWLVNLIGVTIHVLGLPGLTIVSPIWLWSPFQGQSILPYLLTSLALLWVSSVLLILRPSSWVVILITIGCWLLDSLRSSTGKIDHHFIYWCVVWSVLSASTWKWKTLSSQDAFSFFCKYSRFLIAGFYFLAGLHKVSALVALQDPSLFLRIQMLTAISNGNPTSLWGELLYNSPLVGVAAVATTLLELAGILVLKWRRLSTLWCLGVVAFHVGANLTMGVSFLSVIPLLIYFFIFNPDESAPAKA